jgi:putative hemolysin
VFAADGEVGFPTENVLALLTVPVLIVMNGLFVAAEFALVAVRKTRIEELQSQGVQGARSVLTALSSIDRAIAATQLGVTLASIGLGFVGEPALAHLLLPLFVLFLPATVAQFAAHGASAFLAFVIITFFHVVFGELVPKTIALQTPDTIALWMSRPLLWFITLSRPFILLINGAGDLVLRSLGYQRGTGEEMVHSVEELLLLIEDTEDAGLLDSSQADILERVFHLSNKHVSDCMVPKDKMAGLEVNTPPEKVLEAVRSGAHTRMPVYEGEIDNIVGIVNTKDLFYLFSLQGVVILNDALYPALYLRPNESMANALQLFRKSRRHMALVRDTEGHIQGLITLEDVLEEVVGDIEDEHDRPTPKLKRRLVSRRPLGSIRPTVPPPPSGGGPRGA